MTPAPAATVVVSKVVNPATFAQTPLVAARLLAELFGRDESAVRVVAPDVGGGFGPKLVFYPEEAAVAAAALQLGQPVRCARDVASSAFSRGRGRS